MKTITKFIYAAFAAVTLAIGAVTANGAVNDLFASVNGYNNGDNGSGFIYQFTPSGVQSIFASGLNRPRGVAFDHVGNLFVATNTLDPNTGNFTAAIVEIAPDGTQATFANIDGPSANFFAPDVKFDSAGNLFVVVTDFTDPNFASTVYKFTPDGTRSVFVGPSAFLPDQGPVGLAFDRFGNLFVSTEGGPFPTPDDAVLKFTPDGVGSTFAPGLTNYPRGLAFDRAGNLFVAEVGESQNPPAPGDILKFTPNGVGSVFAQNIVPGGTNSGPEFLAVQLLPTPRPRPTPQPRPQRR